MGESITRRQRNLRMMLLLDFGRNRLRRSEHREPTKDAYSQSEYAEQSLARKLGSTRTAYP